ncbi:MAG: GTP cyclohydrolase FolE2 [Casimicrobiaceae bacterium]
MNAPERIELPDMQSRIDMRAIAIDAVGVSGLRYPLTIQSHGAPFPAVATLAMSVGLPATAKGTHMSRFVEVLEAQAGPLDATHFRVLLERTLHRLDAQSGSIDMRFTMFVTKRAPVSGAQSVLDHDVRWLGSIDADGRYAFRVKVCVPATSLCPCSKEISDYGAHNQRSLITIDAEVSADLCAEELIRIAERSASCEVYGLLKRVDEKYVTERAYDNPRFVEDLVREVAGALAADPRINGFTVEAENFESIHNHSAFARISRE